MRIFFPIQLLISSFDAASADMSTITVLMPVRQRVSWQGIRWIAKDALQEVSRPVDHSFWGVAPNGALPPFFPRFQIILLPILLFG